MLCPPVQSAQHVLINVTARVGGGWRARWRLVDDSMQAHRPISTLLRRVRAITARGARSVTWLEARVRRVLVLWLWWSAALTRRCRRAPTGVEFSVHIRGWQTRAVVFLVGPSSAVGIFWGWRVIPRGPGRLRDVALWWLSRLSWRSRIGLRTAGGWSRRGRSSRPSLLAWSAWS